MTPDVPANPTAAELLVLLTACRVGFDSQAVQRAGVTIVPKVAVVPVALYEALKSHLANYVDINEGSAKASE